MKDTIRYGLIKAIPLASKAFLLALSPRVLYATIQPSAANAIIFLLSTLGYISLLSPGRDLLAIQRFDRRNLCKNSLPKNLTLNGLLKYMYLLVFPLLLYSIAIYNLVEAPSASWLLLFVCLVSIIDNYLLPYKAEAHICANPERAYLLQSIFSLLSTIFLISSSLYKDSSTALMLLLSAFGIYFLGQLIATLYFRFMVQASLKAESVLRVSSNEKRNLVSRSVPKMHADSLYIRLAPLLTMVAFGLLPYYYYLTSSQASYQQLMTFYPLFVLPSTALGSVYFTRIHANMRLIYLKTQLKRLKSYCFRLFLMLSLLNAIGSLVVLSFVRLTSGNFDLRLFPFFSLMSVLNAPLIILPSLLLSIDQASVLAQALMITVSMSLASNIFFYLVTPDLSLIAYLSFMSLLMMVFSIVSLCLLRRSLRSSARVTSSFSAQ